VEDAGCCKPVTYNVIHDLISFTTNIGMNSTTLAYLVVRIFSARKGHQVPLAGIQLYKFVTRAWSAGQHALLHRWIGQKKLSLQVAGLHFLSALWAGWGAPAHGFGKIGPSHWHLPANDQALAACSCLRGCSDNSVISSGHLDQREVVVGVASILFMFA
jgi:hypothetical protein